MVGGVLLDNNLLDQVVDLVDDPDFYQNSHRKIYAAMKEMAAKGEAIDYLTLADWLKSREMLDEVGGTAYLATLTDSVHSLGNLAHYARIVRDKAIMRRLISAATEIIQEGMHDSDDVAEYLDRAEQLIISVSQKRATEGVVAVKDLVKKSFETIEKIFQSDSIYTGIPSGFRDLDDKTSGFQKADLIILAGRPSMGKTALALNIAQQAASPNNGGNPTLLFSLEMSKDSLTMRMLCTEARVDFQYVRSGQLTDDHWGKLARAAGNLSDAAIYIDDTPGIRVTEMRAKARRLQVDLSKQGQKLGMIMIDYLQLASASSRGDSREREISEISRSLKALAKELDVPVLALSQLSRKPESRESKRPQMSDLRESGAIEQDADVILFIYRDEVYNEGSPDKGVAEIIIGKQRNGPIGTAKLKFFPEFTRFENLAREQD